MNLVRVDTGGTFTDCWGHGPDISDHPVLVKVLSSSVLRLGVSEILSSTSCRVRIPGSWKTSADFFVGFDSSAGDMVVGFDECENVLSFSGEIPIALRTLELTSGEEAPVLAARLLTGTSLSESFPRLDFRLATTRGTNALLEGKCAEVALFINQGFGDLLEIGDQRRADLFALEHKKRRPLARWTIEVPGRLDAAGRELASLDLEWVRERAREAVRQGARVGAIALLHSYRNSEPERKLREELLRCGFEHVSISSELAPLIRILPRGETAVVNACLQPVMEKFLDQIQDVLGKEQKFLTMTSAGGLADRSHFFPKDSLLSGPAGGVTGAASIARDLGFKKVITFDMGGTSTDVARCDDGFLYQFEQIVGEARLLSPALRIETVASGGGSICSFGDGGLRVGPESAGADPGPACYGRGGPLTITDVNLLLDRIDPQNFGIPLTEENIEAARGAALSLQALAGISSEKLDREFLCGLVDIAVEQMSDAIRTISIREGADPSEYALVAFGGAGPLHACDLAERLGISQILVPAEAGLLSAYGLDRAVVERFAERQIQREMLAYPASEIAEVKNEALDKLAASGYEGGVREILAELRWKGQDATLMIEVDEETRDLVAAFERRYQRIFGYLPAESERHIELVSLRAIAATERGRTASDEAPQTADSTLLGGGPNRVESAFLERKSLPPGACIRGTVVIQDPYSTLFLKKNWRARVATRNGALILSADLERKRGNVSPEPSRTAVPPAEVERELFRHRFEHLVTEMGTLLQRSAISTNVKERQDFSCALLDGEGELIANAPHIPVHLGAMGLCVRRVAEQLRDWKPGDSAVTNHPAYGGSHLPDVTVITPVFSEADQTRPIAWLANRAHHAEIGGISPGSMPPAAKTLAEEGVVLSPDWLVREGRSRCEEIGQLLQGGLFPTRQISNNIADLNAQLAANLRGVEQLRQLVSRYGERTICEQLASLRSQSKEALGDHLAGEAKSFRCGTSLQKLDDGTEIAVTIQRVDWAEKGKAGLRIDFSGTSESHPGNLNATPAIVRSALLYVLRLWTQSSLPLNEGILSEVEIELPACFLNPEFVSDPGDCPAVVGGNVETSQRLVDALIEALGFQACSQGTMNNLIFGDESFGYYETICGGAGAGPGYRGASAVHTHMTNTAITDPEILESRYPVRLIRFRIRRGSGGAGQWDGGDGIVREIEFLEPLEVSLLTQHRQEQPYGKEGGEAGQVGVQFLNEKALPGVAGFSAKPGDRLRIETPGGGGFGKKC